MSDQLVAKRAGDLARGETVFWKGWRALTAVTRYDEGNQHYIVCVADDAQQFAYDDLDEPVLARVAKHDGPELNCPTCSYRCRWPVCTKCGTPTPRGPWSLPTRLPEEA